MKTIFLLIILLGALLIGAVVGKNYIKTRNLIPTSGPTETIGGHTFNIEIAKTPTEKEIGLSSKQSLPQDQGMLFPFDKPGNYSFWMKNMKFPIDIIYIKYNTIVSIFQNVQPPSSTEQELPIYTPVAAADSVLEINAGLSSKYNFKEGDKVTSSNIN